MHKLLKLFGLLAVLIIAYFNDFSWASLLILLFLPLFFIGAPWYSYFTKNKNT